MHLGTEVEPIELYTNYFEVMNRPNWVLYQYHVDFDPSIESKALRCGLLKQHDGLFNNSKAFDGMTLYSMTKLEKEVLNKIWSFFWYKVLIFKLGFNNCVKQKSRSTISYLNHKHHF